MLITTLLLSFVLNFVLVALYQNAAQEAQGFAVALARVEAVIEQTTAEVTK